MGKKVKKIIEACAVEIMVGGGFFITGVLCVIAAVYDGALVCAAVAVVAGIIGRMQWKKHTGARPAASVAAAFPAKPKRKPVKPRKVTKAKKKPARKK